MAKTLKARVLRGRYQGQTVRISNVGHDESGRPRAACIFADSTRANILSADLEVIPDELYPPTPEGPRASMPFMSGSLGSRTMNQARSIAKPRTTPAPEVMGKEQLAICEACGADYDQAERRGQEGKITLCPECALAL